MTGVAGSRWLEPLAGVGAVVIVWLVLASLVPVPENWGHDLPLFVDAAWRVASGQTPHVDFHSALGPLPIELLGLGLRLAEPSVAATFAGAVVAWLVIGLWAWRVAVGRTVWWAATGVAAWTTLIAGAPRPLGFPLEFVTTAMFYNRLAEGLLVTVMLGGFVTGRAPHRTGRTAVWLSVVVGMLLITKLTYAAVAIAIVVVGGWVRRRPWWEAVVVVGGAIVVAVAVLVSLGVAPLAFVDDMARTMAAQDPAGRGARLIGIVRLNIVPLVAVAVAAGVVVREMGVRAVESVHALAVAAAGCALGVALCATNYQQRELPLVAAAAVVIAIRGTAAGLRGRARVAVVCVAVVLPLAHAVRDLGGVWRALEVRAGPHRGPVHVAAPPLADVVIEVPGWVPVLDDGLALLRSYDPRGLRVLVTDLSNPFSYALSLPPPIGDALWWHADKTFSDTVHPVADEVFSTVDLVMEPLRPVDAPTTELMWAVYGDHIRNEYRVVDESRYWRLWARTAHAPRP